MDIHSKMHRRANKCYITDVELKKRRIKREDKREEIPKGSDIQSFVPDSHVKDTKRTNSITYI